MNKDIEDALQRNRIALHQCYNEVKALERQYSTTELNENNLDLELLRHYISAAEREAERLLS